MPSSLRAPPPPEGPKEHIVTRLLIAPLTFISFLVSLALIDTRNTSSRGPQPSTPLGHLHQLVFKPASPYAHIRSPEGRKSEGEPWHWHTKQREQMRAEVADAFRVRRWVLGALLVGVLSSVVGAWVLGRWAMGVVRAWLW